VVDVYPLAENQPLPSMLTLYQRDLHAMQQSCDPRFSACLDLPVKVACGLCSTYPALWPYALDFVQEGNIQLIEACATCDPSWSLSRFKGYVGKASKGAMLQYLARTFDIYIPPTMRHRMVKKRDQQSQVELLEHHVSWERLLEHKVDIADTAHVQAAWNNTKRQRKERMLAQLPTKECEALRKYYGLDGSAWTSREIAAVLGVQTDHAKLLVNTAIKRLKGEKIAPAREWINRERQARLQAAYQQFPRIGVVELAARASCHAKTASAFLKKQRE
jgi:RNA polymerase sigma factor (sigma-70 family)